jgi:hypothetical protein
MSIKGAVKRLEGILARINGSKPVTFVIPYFRDSHKMEQIKAQLINEYSLANKDDMLSIFVIDFALKARC